MHVSGQTSKPETLAMKPLGRGNNFDHIIDQFAKQKDGQLVCYFKRGMWKLILEARSEDRYAVW